MFTAGTTGKRFPSLAGQQGSGLIFLIGLIVVILGAVVFMNSHNNVTASQLATARAKVRGDALVARIHSNLKSVFTAYPTLGASCLPPELTQAAVQAFRVFADSPTPAAPIVIDLKPAASSNVMPAYSCLYDDEDKKLLRSLKIRVTELSHDAAALVRNLNFTVEVGFVKTKGVVDQNFRLARDYRFRVLSLSHFGLIFHHNPPGGAAFIDIEGRAHVAAHTNALFAENDAPSWSQLQPADPKKVLYRRNVYARFQQIQASGTASVVGFRTSYPAGIQTGVLPQDFMTNFLPDNSRSAWNFRFDYYPLYKGVSYPVPEIPSVVTAGSCVSASPPPDITFNSSRAAVTRIPDSAGNGPQSLKQTCMPSLDGTRTPVFLFFRAGEDLTIDMDPNDSNFCGIVVANRLIINIPSMDSLKYGLIGHFAVRSIVVKSQSTGGPTEVRIYNPEENEPLDGLQPLPIGQSLGSLAADFKRLASSSIWNFYVPIAKSGTFSLKSPVNYMKDCGGYSAYKDFYNPIQNDPNFTAYKNDSVGAIFSMESL